VTMIAVTGDPTASDQLHRTCAGRTRQTVRANHIEWSSSAAAVEVTIAAVHVACPLHSSLHVACPTLLTEALSADCNA